MIQKIPAHQRHQADHGWLKTHWLFSFGNYYDPENLGFGALRVFNDDIIMPRGGFPDHPHDTMEIVTIILSGTLTHTDNMGNEATLSAGEVQRMSAGKGVIHAEYNKHEEPVRLYQLWFHPHMRTESDYEEMKITQNTDGPLTVIASPQYKDGLKLYADAHIWHYTKHDSSWDMKIPDGWGHFVYVTEGSLTIHGEVFEAGDQARIAHEDAITYECTDGSGVIIEVKM